METGAFIMLCLMVRYITAGVLVMRSERRRP